MRKGSGLLGNLLKAGAGYGGMGSGTVRVIESVQDYRSENGSLTKNLVNAGIGALQFAFGLAIAKKHWEGRLRKNSEVA